nr:MAG TPA: hypothetical protein [Caudoviricetes sp.]
MRLIDADLLKDAIEKEKGDNDYMCCLCLESTKEIIDEQPIAFDVDEVIEQLKALKMRYFLTIANTGDADKDCAYKNIANTIDRAVEIIKGGGVE